MPSSSRVRTRKLKRTSGYERIKTLINHHEPASDRQPLRRYVDSYIEVMGTNMWNRFEDGCGSNGETCYNLLHEIIDTKTSASHGGKRGASRKQYR
jgi:hypothetical protein